MSAADHPSQRFVGRIAWTAWLAVPLSYAVLAVLSGQDANWDLENYHWYNPYAFLTGRLARDLGVANAATFYSPVFDIPIFLAGNVLPARVMGAVLGFIQGLNFFVLYGLADHVLRTVDLSWRQDRRRLAAAALALIGMLGGGFLGLVGTTFNDHVLSLAVLGGGLIIVAHAATLFAPVNTLPTAQEWKPTVSAGLLLGVAVGLKLPMTIFAVGFCGALLCVGGGLRRRLALAFVFGLGVVAAFAVIDGPWMWMLWRDYGNPLFPYFNSLFHSPMALSATYRDDRFIPHGLAAGLAFPITFSMNPYKAGEYLFRDYRILVTYGVLLATAVIAVVGRLCPSAKGASTSAQARYLIAAASITYVAWIFGFAIYRYIVLLEMLTPILLAAAIASWPLTARARIGVIAASLALLTVTARRADWGHSPWQEGAFVTATTPPIAHPDQTMVLVTGYSPVGWLVPFFPPQIPFIRIHGFLNTPEEGRVGLNAEAARRIDAHQGDFFLLSPFDELDKSGLALNAYNLRGDFDSCRVVASNLSNHARWCPVYRIAGPTRVPPPSKP